MKPMYSTEISIKDARAFLVAYISAEARIPWGSKCVWVAGVRFVTEQPGAYLIAGVGGFEGVVVYPSVIEQAKERAS